MKTTMGITLFLIVFLISVSTTFSTGCFEDDDTPPDSYDYTPTQTEKHTLYVTVKVENELRVDIVIKMITIGTDGEVHLGIAQNHWGDTLPAGNIEEYFGVYNTDKSSGILKAMVTYEVAGESDSYYNDGFASFWTDTTEMVVEVDIEYNN